MDIKSLFLTGSQEDLLNNHPDAIVIIDLQKTIVFWNRRAQEIFGYTRREVIGKDITSVIKGTIENIYRTLGNDQYTILKAYTKIGQEVYVEVTSAENTARDEVIISMRNVTKKHKILESILDSYEQIKKAQQNRSCFVVGLSPELKNPMHSIIGFSQALLDGIGGDLTEKQEKYLSIINKNATSLLSLINSMVDIAKLESGKMEFSYTSFNIMPLINMIIEKLKQDTTAKRLAFSADLDDLIRRNFYSDENKLRCALLNIIDNAVKFTDSGSISLKVSHPDLDYVKYQGIDIKEGYTDKSYVLFSITDTGCGIPESELNTIFDEYRQFERGTKKNTGAGLGLAITKRIIQELGGAIWVESELGQGSTFKFIIPVERPKGEK